MSGQIGRKARFSKSRGFSPVPYFPRMQCVVLYSILLLTFLSVSNGKRCSLTARIPRAIRPDSYNLFLQPHLKEGSFNGDVDVIFKLKSPLRCIPIHSHDLTITRTELWGPRGKVDIASLYPAPEQHYWVTEARHDLPPGNYNISLSFSGSALDKMTGFYRSSYRLPDETNIRYLMTTKFEPTDARRAFPCFDEPALKSRFKIKISKPAHGGYIALSNSASAREYRGPGPLQVTTEFEETPPMSTYLVAAIVCDFKDLGPLMFKSGEADIPLRVYSAPHLVNGTDFARSVGQAVIRFFIDYFDIPFPLPKMDMIAIPDFISGAMENWGLITFRETKLLCMENGRSFNALRRIAYVVAHELSHQWFGNLVTMRWWDDLWLNEGFARFMEYKGVAALTDEDTQGPMVRLEDSPDLLDLKMNVMVKDAMVSSHPIVLSVSKPEQISEIFDSISYAKGASIIMMIEHIMGEKKFQSGVQKYLKNHAFGNAASMDLLSALSHESNMPLTDSIQTWTNQMGFPVVNVQKTRKGYRLTQERFVTDSSLKWSPKSSPYQYKWDIPICFMGPRATRGLLTWFYRSDSSLEISSSNRDFTKFNCRGASFYRTNYDINMWNDFSDILRANYSALDAEERANLLDDSFALANAGYLDFWVPLKLTAYLPKERVRLALASAFSQLLALKSKLGDPASDLVAYIKQVVAEIFHDIFGAFKFDFSKNQFEREEEFYILGLGCKVGLHKCQLPVADYFRQWVNGATTIVPDLRQLVYTTGMRVVGTNNDWFHILDLYRSESDPQEKELLMSALVAAKNETNLKILLHEAFDNGLVRHQDFFGMLSRVGGSAPDLAWQWYNDHYDELVDRFGLSDRGFGRSFEAITAKFITQKMLHDVKAFIKKYPDAGSAAMARNRALEKIRSNMKWADRAKSIATFFDDPANRRYVAYKRTKQ